MMYLSGKMTGIKDLNYPEFNREAKKLRLEGHEVFNPAEIKFDKTGMSEWGIYEGYMDICIAAIEESDTIYLLKGWNNSRGAKRELVKAIKLRLKIVMQGELI